MGILACIDCNILSFRLRIDSGIELASDQIGGNAVIAGRSMHKGPFKLRSHFLLILP